jgi:hypothetical protein
MINILLNLFYFKIKQLSQVKDFRNFLKLLILEV